LVFGPKHREGTSWPECGEIDTFENVSGGPLGYGTLHCGTTCNGDAGLSQGTTFSYGDFHTWAHAIDLKSSDVSQQSVTFYMDGQAYHVIHGSDVAPADWAALTKATYMTLNVAVGGGWPGPFSAATASGQAAGMEVLYVAVYQSN
jgi:beta-glucanase (GH16 family)